MLHHLISHDVQCSGITQNLHFWIFMNSFFLTTAILQYNFYWSCLLLWQNCRLCFDAQRNAHKKIYLKPFERQQYWRTAVKTVVWELVHYENVTQQQQQQHGNWRNARILDEFDCIRFEQTKTCGLVERRHLIIDVFLCSTHTHAHARSKNWKTLQPTTARQSLNVYYWKDSIVDILVKNFYLLFCN